MIHTYHEKLRFLRAIRGNVSHKVRFVADIGLILVLIVVRMLMGFSLRLCVEWFAVIAVLVTHSAV